MSLAPYAVRPETSRGRLHPEAGGDARSPFQRDRDRIIHATAFRRLQYKTQVFVYHEGDHFRTRLTHSIEVAQIARSIARQLSLDEDLSEALALAHDLGHPPFGHAGEDALNSAMKPYGGFDHNAQSLKAVTLLETRYAGFDGLNLTWETLEGLAKHNGPLRRPAPYIAEYDAQHPLDLGTHASAEAQIAALADDIAYNNHDLDDGLRARLFTLEEVGALPLIGDALAEARRAAPAGAEDRVPSEMIRRVINMMVGDVVAESRRRIAAMAPASVDDIRRAPRPVVAFSDGMIEANNVLRDFLFTRMYRHWRVNRTMAKSKRVVQMLFSLLHGGPQMLPPMWRARAGDAGSPHCARVVCDYIAGMTDRYALEEHRRMTDPDIPG
ncbi:deoxyguanosinetriphosphate triphosphohydrolase [Neoroseomonas oryzicola]|uniref:Deoxyguanosinetriphosphate triphosphohydrolase-like protein n=1 Tax=Neoroseomonas oryzicola TaxID=535904 RepID=A0A9X9WCE6_9PROT|nr:deoxyguanosinetriphosphate triphosphohydrolase [Neoroseomonas oryzicola]MBR0658006.1 deoxyguanosinetriphosphate triphosphohydrolase [Neoroseomonas oryzicola]NKE15465.1 deoxyguanosinetriphosphate triphosphohydrolase [Neoroseomonas oryzicola]